MHSRGDFWHYTPISAMCGFLGDFFVPKELGIIYAREGKRAIIAATLDTQNHIQPLSFAKIITHKNYRSAR